MNVFNKEKTLLLWTPQMGLVVRQDGILKYISTGVDASQELVDGEYEWGENHLTQTVASQQPRLVGGIAPGSKPAASNQNGEARYFTHPAISFGANEEYSVTTVHNWNNGNTADERHFGQANAVANAFALKIANNNLLTITFGGTTFQSVLSTNELIGKTAIVSYVVKSGSKLIVYFNGIEKLNVTVPNDTLMTFNSIFNGRDTGRMFNGKWLAYHIQSGALTATQVTALHNTLRGMYPEIETVTIGTQTWASRNFEAVATPLGNVIPEVQLAAATNLIPAASSTFGTDGTGYYSQINGGLTWNSGTFDATYTSTTALNNRINKTGLLKISRYYRIKFKLKSATQTTTPFVFDGHSFTVISAPAINTNYQQYEFYGKAVAAVLEIWFGATPMPIGNSVTIDDIEVIEAGWSSATEIYDYVYAATAGTTAQKEYAALKEAAMWRYPNNDVNKGAWAGKFYNKYAKRLLALDMLSSNFGYNLPSENDVDELLSYVGDDTNKLKYTGLDYWNDDLGTNETGLTLLGTGVITPEGAYVGEKELTGFWTSDSDELPTTGLPIRLIKDV